MNFTWYAHFKYCKNYKDNFFHLRQTVRNIKLVQSFGNIRFTVSTFHEFIMIRSKIANEKTHSLNHCFNFSLLWWSESQKKNKVMKLLCLYIYIWIKYELNSNYYLFFNVCVYFWFVFHFLGEISLVFCMFFILPLFSKYLWVTFCY